MLQVMKFVPRNRFDHVRRWLGHKLERFADWVGPPPSCYRQLTSEEHAEMFPPNELIDSWVPGSPDQGLTNSS